MTTNHDCEGAALDSSTAKDFCLLFSVKSVVSSRFRKMGF